MSPEPGISRMQNSIPLRRLGKTGWQVSLLSLGTSNLSGHWGPVDPGDAINTIRTALDHGINFFDTADSYGDPAHNAEELLGRALGGDRSRCYVATKVGNFGRRQGHPLVFTSPLHVRLCCEASLHRLGTDYIDLYQCHLGHADDYSVFIEAFEQLQSEGKIRAFGISTPSLSSLERFNANDTCATLMTEYHLAKRRAALQLIPYCVDHDIGVIGRSPLAMGGLVGKYAGNETFDDHVRSRWNSGKGRSEFQKRVAIAERVKSFATKDRSVAQIALKFALSLPSVATVVAGAKNPAQVRANLAALEVTLSADEMSTLVTSLKGISFEGMNNG